jgi:predicted transcriptional regulator
MVKKRGVIMGLIAPFSILGKVFKMANDAYKVCGGLCRKYRQEILNITQEQVAKELDYSQENISAFENGRNSNNIIFMWYVRNGILNHFSLDELCGGCS